MLPGTIPLVVQLHQAVLAASGWVVPDTERPIVTMGQRIDSIWFPVFFVVVIPLCTIPVLLALARRLPKTYRGASERLAWVGAIPFAWPIVVWLLGWRMIPIGLGEWANDEEKRHEDALVADWQARQDAIAAGDAPADPGLTPIPPKYTLQVGDCGKTIGLLWGVTALGLVLGFLSDYFQYAFGLAFFLMLIIYFYAGKTCSTTIARCNQDLDEDGPEDRAGG